MRLLPSPQATERPRLTDDEAPAVAAGDGKAALDRMHRAGRVGGHFPGNGLVDLDAFPVHARRGTGPRNETAHLAVDLPCAPRPVDGRKRAVEHGRIGECRLVLRCALRRAVRKRRDRLAQRLRAELSKALCQRRGVLALTDLGRDRADDIARVERCNHIHDRNAGDTLAVQDRPVDGRGAAILRQKRGVNVDAAVLRQV